MRPAGVVVSMFSVIDRKPAPARRSHRARRALGWEHIALTSDYIWNGSNPSTNFRPLRDVHTAFLPQVA
jgi:hypothetical protein